MRNLAAGLKSTIPARNGRGALFPGSAGRHFSDRFPRDDDDDDDDDDDTFLSNEIRSIDFRCRMRDRIKVKKVRNERVASVSAADIQKMRRPGHPCGDHLCAEARTRRMQATVVGRATLARSSVRPRA